jgi:hypothetical protein
MVSPKYGHGRRRRQLGGTSVWAGSQIHAGPGPQQNLLQLPCFPLWPARASPSFAAPALHRRPSPSKSSCSGVLPSFLPVAHGVPSLRELVEICRELFVHGHAGGSGARRQAGPGACLESMQGGFPETQERASGRRRDFCGF